MSLHDVIRELSYYIKSGGFVMPPLLVATFVLWFAMGWRFFTLKRGSSLPLRKVVANLEADPKRKTQGMIDEAARRGLVLLRAGLPDLRGYLDDCFGSFEVEMKRFQVIIQCIVLAAPLTGLLGTVTGMIETFDSLGSMSLFSQSGGIAGGISQALISTQMGLAVAVPAVVAGRILERKQQLLLTEMEQLKDLLCGEVTVS